MTWDEFKFQVDKKLKEEDVDGGSVHIFYIDISDAHYGRMSVVVDRSEEQKGGRVELLVYS